MRLILATITTICLSMPALADSASKTAKAAPTKNEAEAKNVKVEQKKAAKEAAKTQKRPDGLVIEDVKVGSGKEAKLNSTIKVHYVGTLKKDGTKFDSSYDRKEAIEFQLAEGRLIKGWTEGIPGMKVGGKRKLSIPYAMAYGEQGRPPAIPEKSDLNFEVELIDVK